MLYLHVEEREKKKKRSKLSDVSCYKGTNPVYEDHLMTSSKLDHLPKAPPPNAITRGLEIQHMNLGETHSVHNKPEIKVRGEIWAAIFKDELRHKTCGDNFFQKVNQRLKPDFLKRVAIR